MLLCTRSYVGPVYPALHVQAEIEVEPFGDPLDDAHRVHSENPAKSEYVFTGQSGHADVPGNALNLPAAHSTHARAYTASYVPVASSTCVYPALQTQLVMFGAAAGDCLPPAHVTHAAGPVTFLYLPATQATQTSPVFPVYPAAQEHSALPLADTLFAWQLRHADDPDIRLYVPAGHAVQLVPTPVKPALHSHAAFPPAETVLPVHTVQTPSANAAHAAQVTLELGSAKAGASRIVAGGRPAAASAEFSVSAVRLVVIPLATLSLWACTLVSTLMAAASKRLRTPPPPMSRIRTILTSALDTPAASATESLNAVCALPSKSCLLIGSDTDILITNAPTTSIVQFTPSREYIPVGQLVHVLAPLAFENMPNMPSTQFTHAPVPVAFLYCPAAHGEHTPPFDPENPASQAQLVIKPLEAPAREFAGHRLQFGLPSGDHWPSGHARHVSFPTAP